MNAGQVEDLLIHMLVNRGATRDETTGIMLLLQTPQEQWELVKWLAENRAATMQEIIQTTLDIQVKKT